MSNGKIIVAVTIGSVNLSTSGGTLSCFKLDRPFKRDSILSVAKGSRTSYRESTGAPRGGKFMTTAIPLEDGDVVMVQGRRTQNGLILSDAVMFFRARSTGPLTSLLFKPPEGQHFLGRRLEAFQGRGDLLSLDQMTALGYQVPRKFVDTYLQEEEIEELFDTETIGQGSVPTPEFATVATEDGLKVVAMAREPARRIRVRR